MKNFITLLAVTMLVLFLLIGYSTNVNSNLSQNIVRLHVLANSDSEDDQSLKLKVRDAILEQSRTDFTKKEDVKFQLDIYKDIAEKIVAENGYDYPVHVEYGNFSFPTKNYDRFSLPAGNYDAVRIKLGSAQGQNWWCVMFPPLCFVDGTTDAAYAESKLRSSISEESYDIISAQNNKSTPFTIKFKIVEFYGKISGRDKIYAKTQ